MSSRIEELAKIKSDYLKNLETISYDEVIDKLMDSNNVYQITFFDQYDVLENKTYMCVKMFKNEDTSTLKEYKTPDQKDYEVYTGIMLAISQKGADPVYQTVELSGKTILACQVDNSILLFPNIFKELQDWSENTRLTSENSIWCVYNRTKEIQLRRDLPCERVRKDVRDINKHIDDDD